MGGVLRIETPTISSALTVRTSRGIKVLELVGPRIEGDLRFLDGGAVIALKISNPKDPGVRGGITATRVTFTQCGIHGIAFRGLSKFVAACFKLPSFRSSKFTDEVVFEACVIGNGHGGTIDFRDVNFNSGVSILGGEFGSGPGSTLNFQGATIGRADFQGVDFNCDVNFRCRILRSTKFRRLGVAPTVFRRDADLRPIEPFHGPVSFAGVEFCGGPSIQECNIQKFYGV